jgi:hypothetical protein
VAVLTAALFAASSSPAGGAALHRGQSEGGSYGGTPSGYQPRARRAARAGLHPNWVLQCCSAVAGVTDHLRPDTSGLWPLWGAIAVDRCLADWHSSTRLGPVDR